MRRHFGVLVLVAALAALPSTAQSKPDPGPAPCKTEPDPVPCGSPSSPTPANKPTATQKFPFPGETSGTASPSVNKIPDAPAVSPPAGAQKTFPFPGEPATTTTPDASSSSSSSSSSGDAPTMDADGNPAAPALQDKGTEGTAPAPGRHILHRVNPVGTKLQSQDERETEDLDVAHFYVQNGDLKGAYLRSQDAVKTAPDDPDAHFALAGIALKLNKRDEAIAEYSACLKLEPADKQAREARKALAKLKP